MWQKCCLCNGTGQYDQFNKGIFSTACPVCKGQRIISELNGLPPRPNFGQELIKDNDNIDNKTQEEMLEYFEEREEKARKLKFNTYKNRLTEQPLTKEEIELWDKEQNKKITDNLFNIAKQQYLEIDEEILNKQSNLENIKSTSSFLKDLES